MLLKWHYINFDYNYGKGIITLLVLKGVVLQIEGYFSRNANMRATFQQADTTLWWVKCLKMNCKFYYKLLNCALVLRLHSTVKFLHTTGNWKIKINNYNLDCANWFVLQTIKCCVKRKAHSDKGLTTCVQAGFENGKSKRRWIQVWQVQNMWQLF